MSSSNRGGRAQRIASSAGGARANLAQWLDEHEPDSSARLKKPSRNLDDLTAKLELLAERLAPEDFEDAYDDDEEHEPELNRLVAALAQRTQENEDRIATALEALTRVIATGKTPAHSYADNYSPTEARDFPPPPPPPPSRDDRLAEIEKRLAQLTEEKERQSDGRMAAPRSAPVMEPKASAPASIPSFTFAPYDVAPQSRERTGSKGTESNSKLSPERTRLKDAVSEITARQRALSTDGRHESFSRVKLLEGRIADLAAKVDASTNPSTNPTAVYLTREMEDLKGAVQSLAKRVTVPLAADGSPQMLNSIYRALDGLSRRFDEQGATTMSAETLDQLRDGVEALTARLDKARPGEETRSVLNTIQRSIEHLAVRLDQAVQAPSTSEALIAMHAAINGIGQQVSKIGTLANRSENLVSLENTIENLIAELRTNGKTETYTNSDLGVLKLSIDTLTDRLANPPAPTPSVSNETLTSVERAIEDLSYKLESNSFAASDQGALRTIQRAIEDLADKMERNASSGDSGEASAAIHNALEALATRIDISDQRLQKLASLESMVQNLAHIVENHQGASIETAQTAATRAVREALNEFSHSNAHEHQMSTLADTVMALQNQSEKAERRTVDAFDSVRSTLERIIDKLQDDHGTGSEKHTAEVDPVTAARAAARRAMSETPIAPPRREIEQDGDRNKRARFIAAARRAATPSVPAPEVTEPEAASSSFNFSAAQLPLKNRRPLMIGVAGILLVLGSFQFGKMALKTPAKTGETVAEQEATAPAEQKKISNITPSAPALKADTNSAATPTDPVVTGSIPASPAKTGTSETLDVPATIGGPTLVESARQGDAAALYEVGVRYFDGDRVERDMAKAVQWFEKAAEQGYAPAQYRVANAFDKGHGVSVNPGQAESWYRKAADQGHIKAMHNLAVLLAEGSLGKPDYPQAGYWFRRAADRGVRDSQYNLGVMLARGLGVNQDLADAYKWFAIAASAGDADSATKRDQVAAKLKPATLVAARLEAQTWQPLPKDALANDESEPAGGWDGPVKSAARTPQS